MNTQLFGFPILVIDLEATCDDKGSIPADQMEIIEIGAVWALPDGQVLDTFTILVKPTLNPKLTPFCTELTGITQSDVDAGNTLIVAFEALKIFSRRHHPTPLTWGSWGYYDFKQLANDCTRLNIVNPLNDFIHINLKRQFSKKRQIRDVGMSKALELTNQKLDGNHHRALDDTLNIARLLPWCL
jgi:inhibitor of KinA sporulation pathway (predicted exonuclease)